VNTSPNKEAPGLLAVWRNWHTVACSGVAGVAVVTAVLLSGWARSDAQAAEEASRDRLRSVGQAIAASGQPDALDPSRLESVAAALPAVDSILMMQSPAAASTAAPGRVLASVPLGEGRGFLVLEGALATRSVAGSMALPGIISLLTGCGAAGVGIWFARRTAGLRRVGSALAAIERGENSAEVLSIAERFGPEAATWNRVVAQTAHDSPLQSESDEDEDRREQHIPGGDISTSTLDAIPFGIVGLDRAGRVLFCNGAAAAMLGVNRREAIAERFDTLETLAELSADILRVSDGETPRHACEMQREASGGAHTLRVGIRSLRKTDGAHVMVMIEDITQQRLTDAARDSFVAQATHELRTPLTNIKLAAEEAIDAALTDPETVSMSLNIVNQEARRLERVVTDMLSVSEMEAASMSLSIDDVSPAKLLDHLETDYRNQAREKGIELTVNKPPKLETVFGDREKIGLLLHNIVGNAVKYTLLERTGRGVHLHRPATAGRRQRRGVIRRGRAASTCAHATGSPSRGGRSS
jgi:PAS domain S-box-containing protein